MNLPPIIGHRGARAMAPENTIAGFQAAARAGATWIECDLRLTADAQAVIFHDATLDRTSNGRGLLAHVTLADLRRLDAGSWFDESFAGESIPTLTEGLAAWQRLGLGANLELKPEPGRQGTLVAALAEALPTSVPLLLSSFDRETLRACQDIIPEHPRALIADRLPDDWRTFATDVSCSGMNIGAQSLTRDQVESVHADGLTIAAWTVNDLAFAQQLIEWGIDAVITDNPALLLAEMNQQG
ncbi:glycerophosphodiester phosphodiesterase family protein [Magnetospira thiophila]